MVFFSFPKCCTRAADLWPGRGLVDGSFVPSFRQGFRLSILFVFPTFGQWPMRLS